MRRPDLQTLPHHQEEIKNGMEQLVLAWQCLKPVLELAHDRPLASHLVKEDSQMYPPHWPTLFEDVAACMHDYCRSCSCLSKDITSTRQESPIDSTPNCGRTISEGGDGHSGTTPMEPLWELVYTGDM